MKLMTSPNLPSTTKAVGQDLRFLSVVDSTGTGITTTTILIIDFTPPSQSSHDPTVPKASQNQKDVVK
jgi:hypothetical protein